MTRNLALLGLLGVKAVLGFVVGQPQIPFQIVSSQDDATYPLPPHDPDEASAYKFQWPIKRVAIIGAGPSGLIAYREFTQAGFEAHLFERDHAPGGNWHYSDETPVDAPIPNADVSIGDYVPDLPPQNVGLPYEVVHRETEDDESYKQRRREFRGPKPVWDSLTANLPAPLQQITEWAWPAGTPWLISHFDLQRYLRSFASWHGINANDGNPNVSYNTRVELVEKRYDEDGKRAGWRIVLKELVRDGAQNSRTSWREEDFDAVVVATGRYNAPHIPDIPGLKEWSKIYGNKIIHSRQYRRPQQYSNETLLVVGSATSAVEISRDVHRHAGQVYQSVRPIKSNETLSTLLHLDLLYRLPKNVTIIEEIRRFHKPTENIQDARIELTNGTIITGVDKIIFATGYRYSFPFLRNYHNSSIPRDRDAPRSDLQPIVTDGTHLRALHLDLFYIPDPTLAFVDMSVGIQSFMWAEYLSLALAKVWSRRAYIPDTEELWRLYDERVRVFGGYGENFQTLAFGRDKDLLRYFVGWLNTAASKYGGRQINQVPPGLDEMIYIWVQARYSPSALEALVNATDYRSSSNTLTGIDPRVDSLVSQYQGSQDGKDRLWDIISSARW
ncbi:hypothetical protein AX16_003538 [Volvariella volvacea WC 439]|nr:hypothetical protein AX16_003538 [Volvariella volvacea WC 439]